MDHKPTLISVVGPTAVGKTSFAIQIAKKLDAEIISGDSRQFYRELTIGTAKPTILELEEAKHHFIDSHSILEEYSAGEFERDALSLLEVLFKKKRFVVLVGGSGMYVNAVWNGFDDMPEVPKGLREQIMEEFQSRGLKPLLEELEQRDSEYFNRVDQKNHQRVIRAIEVIRCTGKPFSFFRNKKKSFARPFSNIKIGLEMHRDTLNHRIDQRMDHMIANGLFEEAKSLYEYRELNALQTVGYKEIFPYLDGMYDKDEAIRLLKRNSRRYAKRQMTWFKADPEINWFDATKSVDDILISLHLL